jgi:signal transduction histidine kinase/DNA-binding response OmpR family regulator/streptogramin lyase
MYKWLNIFVIGLLLTSNVFTQSIHFNHLTTEDGLSNNIVFDIIQDRFGFLWFATDDGLDRYDGYDFRIFRNDPENKNSISDNSSWVLTEDRKGNIWIGTKNGWLNRFDPVFETFTRWQIKTENVNENAITCVYEDTKEKIWIGTYRQGLYRLDPESGELDHWQNQPDDNTSLSNNYISSILEDRNGNYWISTYFGLNQFNPQSSSKKFNRFFKIPSSTNCISDNIIWRLKKSDSDENEIWIGTANGLTKYNVYTESFKQLKIPNPDRLQFGNSAGGVIEEVNNNKEKILWIDSYAGLVRLNVNDGSAARFIKNKDDPNSLSSTQVHKIFKDRSGVLWIATNKGLNYFSLKSTKFNYLFSENFRLVNPAELSKKNIKAITITSDKTIWFGTDEGLYYSFTINGKSTVNKLENSEKLNVWSLTADALNNLWIGTYGSGLFEFNLKNRALKNVKMFSEWVNTQSVNFNKVVYSDKENKIWIGYWGFGLACLDPASGKYRDWRNEPDNPNSLSYDDVWAIYQDKKGRMWIGTDGGGLNLFIDEDSAKFFRWKVDKKQSICSNSIYSICESFYLKDVKENSTILWLGTNNGLNKFVVNNSTDLKDILSRPEVEMTHFSIEHGLSDNTINSIVEDENGNLWIGTSSGISFFNTRQNKFTNFSKADGVIGSDINLSSAIRNKNGVIFMGSTEGLNYFSPDDIKLSSFVPALLITDFQIFNQSVIIGQESILNKSVFLTKEVVLAHTQNVFSFKFTALDYTSPRSIQYKYMLEGFDKEWINSGSRRFITYTNLYPGEYKLKVKSTNSDQIWNDNISELKIIITPPWWQAPWAIGIYALIFLLGVWGIIKFQNYRTRLQNELKMQEFEAHHLREVENMKSRFFANLSHEFRTPLTLIKGPLEQLISGRIKENLADYYKMLLRNTEKLQSLIDQLLELSQLETEAIPLNKQNYDLSNLLRSLTYTFIPLAEEKFITLGFNSSVDRISVFIDRDKLEKIINNLLSNAFKFTPAGGIISVNLNIEKNKAGEIAIVTVSDTGIGIPEEFKSKIFDRFFQVDSKSNKNQTGSGIGLALVKELVELHNWEISVENNQGNGTVFKLKIPLEKVPEVNDQKKIPSFAKSSDESQQELASTFEADSESESDTEDAIETKPVILFVEDSPDVRSYVFDLLNTEYKVLVTERAEEGIELALKNMPDLILSDLMMPGMDGIEFCQRIKTNWQTSHIPFILLTAKVTEESKIAGLETGADDYLTKPFNYEELAVRIKNLINQRNTLRDKFSKEINIQPSSLTTSTIDNEFLQKVLTISEKNLNNEKFDTESLAQEMFVSRRQLHRKLQAITGQGPGEFIRTLRLKRAAQMLIEKKMSVTQIALEVGFESPAQFTRAFKKHFNILPSEFNQQIRDHTELSKR